MEITLVRELQGIVGEKNVFTRDSESFEKYSHDETEDIRRNPDIVVLAESTRDVSEVMKIAFREGIPVTPRGGGSSLSGGAIPVRGGIVLSLEKMNRILEIDVDNLTVTVEPGVFTQTLQEAVEKHGLYYPPDPASRGFCMIGGNLAHNAGGPHAVKYGVTREYVLGLECVLADGSIIQTGGRTIKNVTGYNLTQLIVGSEGTLAIITKSIHRLVPLPKFRKALLAAYDDPQKACDTVAKIFQAGIVPSACEFMERDAIQAAEKRKGEKFPLSEFAALLLVEIDGMYEEILNGEIQKVGEICLASGAADVVVAEDRGRLESLWVIRRSIGEAVKKISPYREIDVVVPRASLSKAVAAAKSIAKSEGLQAICYGHAGDGNIHVNVLKGDMEEGKWKKAIDVVSRKIVAAIVSMGGTLTGEHGVGLIQKNYLPIALEPEVIRLMREIKKVFDPKNILNPGKVLPDA